MKRGHVLVTGASRGIGSEVARVLATLGYGLVLWARTEQDLGAVADECQRHGADVRWALVDVADEEQVTAAGGRSLEGLTALRAAVINAGEGAWGALTETTPQQWRTVMATNLEGAFHSVRLALPLVRRHGVGQVIAIGSDSGLYATPGRAAYSASKAGLMALMEVVRAECRPDGVRVTTLAPSRVDTYFRGKRPGMRPQSLSAIEVATVVASVLELPTRVEIREMRLAAITSTYGPYPEVDDGERD
jgi:NADP-dependent 3-hydroxy acid dehydrogenase YdfG